MMVLLEIAFILIFIPSNFLLGSVFINSKNKNLQDFLIKEVLGIGILAYFVLFYGLFVSCSLGIFGVILIIALILAIYYYYLNRNLVEKSTTENKEKFYTFDYFLIAAIFLLFVGHLVLALSPSIKWDAATHHYLVPKLWIKAGKITPLPETIFAEYPSIIEMLYMVGLMISIHTANLIGLILSVLLGLSIFKFTSERFTSRTGLVATLIFFSTPLTLELATGGLIDIGYSLFTFISFWMFIEYLEKGNRRSFYLACVFAGFALGSKHLGIEFIISLILAYLFFLLLHRKFKAGIWLKDSSLLILIALAFGLPWYAKSYIFTGNPVYPFLPGIFGGHEIREPISVHAWSRPDYQRSLITFLTYPWKLTTDFSFLDFWIMAINPIFLGTVPLWIMYRSRFPSVTFCFSVSFIIVFTIIAYRIAPSATRYMLPMFCVISEISGASMVFVSEELKRLGKTILVLTLIFPFMVNFLVEMKRARDVFPWFAGRISDNDVYLSDFEGYDSIMFINENLPKDAYILSTDPKGFFINRKFVIGTPGAQSQLIPSWTEKDSMVVLNGWKKLGITHLLFNLSRNVMKNSYFVYTVTKGIEEQGELIMTAEELAELTKYETEYTYKPEEIAEFGRITQTPTIIKDGKIYYHLYPEWWEKTVKQDRSQYMLRHYLNLKPYLKEIARFKSAIVYEIKYPDNPNEQEVKND